jgi:hypothetical protein
MTKTLCCVLLLSLAVVARAQTYDGNLDIRIASLKQQIRSKQEDNRIASLKQQIAGQKAKNGLLQPSSNMATAAAAAAMAGGRFIFGGPGSAYLPSIGGMRMGMGMGMGMGKDMGYQQMGYRRNLRGSND